MLKKHLQEALQLLEDAIGEIKERGIQDEVLIAALARQLYNRIQLRSSELSDQDLEDQ